ncbi:DoxX family membrane protein [Neorickettsia sennetsu]|uniref:DoxX family membrane protein n=1 Tax=Ehrlichia sennetsu TaxID=951 RepID=UPI0002DE4F52|nr:DoxX family membrane protein [Neorickettsia sennetsu]
MPIVLEEYFVPLLVLTVRLWMAGAFVYYGLSRLSGFLYCLLFSLCEYRFSLLGSVLWAVLCTASDVVSALLVSLGLLSRVASFQMLVATTIVYLSHSCLSGYFHWLVAGSVLALFGFSFSQSALPSEEKIGHDCLSA